TYAGVGGVSVTFAMGGQEWVATTSGTGYAGVVVVIDLDPGEYELHITTEASGEYRAGAGMQPFTVTANASPTVKLGSIQSTEAGYRSRVLFGTSDPDGDIVKAEWDMNGDGVVDATTGAPENFGAQLVFVDYVYPAAYQGLVTVTVIDSAGNRASGNLLVDIKPYEPLGSLTMLSIDDAAVRAIGMDDSGRRVLHRATVPGSAPTRYRLAVLDRETGESDVVSIGTDGNLLEAELGAISPDGNVVAFMSAVPGSVTSQVFVRDLVAGTTTIISVDSKGALGNDRSTPIALSNDGSRVMFSSEATNLGPLACDGCDATYVWDRDGGVLRLVSLDPEETSVEASAGSGDISADGSVVAMVLRIGNQSRVVVRDIDAGISTLASVSHDGQPSTGGAPKLNADGSVVVFGSSADDLFPGDTNGSPDVVIRDMRAQVTRPVSSMLAPADGASSSADISGDGTRVVFDSNADPRTGTRTQTSGVYVADLTANTVTLISREPRRSEPANDNSLVMGRPGWITCDGRFALFMSEASNLVPGDVSDLLDSFVEDTGVSRPCDTDGNTAPVVLLAVPPTIAEGSSGLLVASATDADGDVLTYTWVTDHGTITGSGATAQLAAVDGPAVAQVTLTVSDGTVEVSLSRSITILNVAPTVQIVSPALGTRVTVGTSVQLDTIVADAAGPADPVTCAVTWGDATSSSTCNATHVYGVAGSFTIAVTADDADGGSTTATRTVIVEAPSVPECQFEGFYAPVDNLPTINTVKAGSNIPLKFKFCSDGRLAIFANGSPTSSAHSCGTGSTAAVEETSPPGANTLSFDASSQRYHYNWKTERSWAGQCRTLTFPLIDGTVVSAEFKFR
ncbi:MAG TPA: PxKF domain-containing protein, partial [Ilumatobacter sp.]|nr:PxKF domain-containing protein [Ilumatobacter sp.]